MSGESPGVYVKEVSSGVKPIAGVGTATGAFVGIAQKGPIGVAKEIPNKARFTETFGDLISEGFLAYAVKQFFDEGGTRCYVVRTCHYDTISSKSSQKAMPAAAILLDGDATPGNSMRVKASSDGKWGNDIKVSVGVGTEASTFKLIVKYKTEIEELDNLKITDVEEKVKNSSKYISVEKDSWTVGGTTTPGSGKPPKATIDVPMIGGDDGITGFAAVTLKDTDNKASIRVKALSGGSEGNSINVEVGAATDAAITAGFKLTVNGTPVETYDNLTISTIESSINGKSTNITVEKDSWIEGYTQVTGSGKPPKDTTDAVALTSGYSLQKEDFEGDELAQNGLHAFDMVDDINIVAMPDAFGRQDAISAGLMYCSNRHDCFFIADPANNLEVDEIKTFRQSFSSSFGALYYPWVIVSDSTSPGGKRALPPSGAVAGTYAHVDTVRGVHKAPAGTPDGYLDTVIDLQKVITASEHDGLHPLDINIIRKFPSSGICIWGANTLAGKSDPEWKYINIRRLFLYIEESIDEATQWVVFEPNSPALWGSVIRNITAFLLMVWRNGALYGGTQDEAFYVKCDEELNPPEARDLGQLNIEIGVAPIKPAEFVIIRIKQKTLAK